MRIQTADYPHRKSLSQSIRSLIEGIAQDLEILDLVESVFIGRASTYHNMECKAAGKPATPLPYPDALIIVIKSNKPGANIRYTVANEQGIQYGMDNPTIIAPIHYLRALQSLKEAIQRSETKN